MLLAPLGTDTLLEALHQELEALDVLQLAVLPNFEPGPVYEQALRAVVADVTILRPPEFAPFLSRFELADRLLLVDARAVPIGGWGFNRWLNGRHGDQPVRHLVQAVRPCGGSVERVEYDEGLRLRSVRRLYDGVTRLTVANVICSRLPVAAARCLSPDDTGSLPQVRFRLVQAGLPSLDVPQPGVVLDLTTPQGLLAANEAFLGGRGTTRRPPAFARYAADVLIGPGVRIPPSSRLYGPVVLHELAALEPGAVVVGPAVVGARARVGRESTVARSVIWPGTRVAPRAVVVGRVLVAAANAAGADGKDGDCANTPAAALIPNLNNGQNGRARRRQRFYRPIKRALDLLVSLPGLVLLAPLLMVVAALIKLTSRGPVLFGHEREGLNGRPFRCWKFRTMVHHAHRQQRELYAQNLVDGPQFKLAHDERITPLGHILRRTNIDELPQLFNVLRGEMSLIGPRPSPFRENQICVPWRQARLSVRPGITGLWQVCRRDRDAGDFHQWIYYDLLYVRHQSLWLDLRILLATALTLAGRWPVPLEWMIPRRRLATFESLMQAGVPGLADAPLTSQRRGRHGNADMSTVPAGPRRPAGLGPTSLTRPMLGGR